VVAEVNTSFEELAHAESRQSHLQNILFRFIRRGRRLENRPEG
jgi:hypothetical protein